MRDSVHPEHEATVTRSGGGFDPEDFSLNSVNAALAALR